MLKFISLRGYSFVPSLKDVKPLEMYKVWNLYNFSISIVQDSYFVHFAQVWQYTFYFKNAVNLTTA